MTNESIVAPEVGSEYISVADLEKYRQHLAADFDRFADQLAVGLKNNLRSLGGDTHTLADVRQAVLDGRMQLWCGPHSAIITELLNFPQKRVLSFFIICGNAAELWPMFEVILDWGRAKGCRSTRVLGRPAFARLFSSRGWRQTGIVVERDL